MDLPELALTTGSPLLTDDRISRLETADPYLHF